MPRKGRMVPVTVRFSPDAYETISDIADGHDISIAELVRRSVSMNLADYLGAVRIIDPDQAEDIKTAIGGLFTEVSRVADELNRIGVNYNQEIRLMNQKREHAGDGMALPADAVDAAVARFEAAAREAGGLLCRLLS